MMDRIDELITRLNKNLADYHDQLVKGFGKKELIGMAGRINAMNDAHTYLTRRHAFDYEQAEYLLKFQNPLEIVADKWETRISDLSDMSYDLDKIFYDKDAENNGYELAGAEAPASEQPPARDMVTTLLDRCMTGFSFERAMLRLLPEISTKAIDNWISYANSMEYKEGLDARKHFMQLGRAFHSVKEDFGEHIASQVFHIAFEMPIPVDEIRGAAEHLKNGGKLNDIIDLSLDGKLRPAPGNPEPAAAKPDEKREPVDVKAEAERIVAAIKQLTGPNSPNKTHYAIQVSRDFMNNARSSDTGKLLKALPFKNTALTSLNGEKGIFVTVPENEVQKNTLSGELENAKKQAAAQSRKRGTNKSKDTERG